MPTSNHDSRDHRLQPLPHFSAAVHVPPLTLSVPRRASQPAPKYDCLPIEPLEPTEPCASIDGRFGSSIPKRSNLSPSQRAALRRPQILRDGHYITYTIEPR